MKFRQNSMKQKIYLLLSLCLFLNLIALHNASANSSEISVTNAHSFDVNSFYVEWNYSQANSDIEYAIDVYSPPSGRPVKSIDIMEPYNDDPIYIDNNFYLFSLKQEDFASINLAGMPYYDVRITAYSKTTKLPVSQTLSFLLYKNQNSISQNINNGNILMNNSPIAFNNVTLDSDIIVKSNANTTVQLNDSRGSGSGWSINLAITDFISQSVNDPSSNGNGQFQVKFPASAVTFTTTNPTLITGQNINATYGPLSYSGNLSNVAQNLVNTSPGYGMGIYEIPVDFEMTIPKTVQIHALNGNGSKYAVNDSIGTIAGTYTSTFTFTQSIGI